ncbi:MAG: DUF6644 family protein [Caulobacteraceae bacterium]
MNAFLDAVGRTPLSQLMQDVRWLIPLIQSTHILALSLVFVSATVVDLRILGVAGRGQPLTSLTSRFLPWVGWGVLLLLVTGLLLMMAEPRRAILNPLFQIKMAALVVAGGMTWFIAAKAPAGDRSIAKSLAVSSLVLWLVIIALGRWIAYGP